MTGPIRLRVVTPEALDALVANLVNTGASATGTAVANKAGTGTPTTTGVVTATASTLMQRDAAGRSQIVTPTVGAEIANKTYVDTQVALYVPLTQRGAVSGVATLDSAGFVPAAQMSTVFPRSLGSGTSFPASKNTGDVFTHTGIGCQFRWDGSTWFQAGSCSVATRTARNTLSSTYSSVLPTGFVAVQVDHPYRWRWTPGGWVYDGWAGGSVYGDTVNTTTKMQYSTQNLSVPTGTNYTPAGFAQVKPYPHLTAQEWLTYSGSGVFTVNDDCNLSIQLYIDSDGVVNDRSTVGLFPPGAAASWPLTGVYNTAHRVVGYTNAGMLGQNVQWTGAVTAGSTFSTYIIHTNGTSTALTYNVYLSVELLPS